MVNDLSLRDLDLLVGHLCLTIVRRADVWVGATSITSSDMATRPSLAGPSVGGRDEEARPQGLPPFSGGRYAWPAHLHRKEAHMFAPMRCGGGGEGGNRGRRAGPLRTIRVALGRRVSFFIIQ